MMRPLCALIDTLGALWVLATLALRSGFRLRSAYWKWRFETAFPGGRHPSGRAAAARAALGYARWAWRIRRLR